MTSPDPTYRERLGRALWERTKNDPLVKSSKAWSAWGSLSEDAQEQIILDALAVETIVRERCVEEAEEMAREQEDERCDCGYAVAPVLRELARQMREGS